MIYYLQWKLGNRTGWKDFGKDEDLKKAIQKCEQHFKAKRGRVGDLNGPAWLKTRVVTRINGAEERVYPPKKS